MKKKDDLSAAKGICIGLIICACLYAVLYIIWRLPICGTVYYMARETLRMLGVLEI